MSGPVGSYPAPAGRRARLRSPAPVLAALAAVGVGLGVWLVLQLTGGSSNQIEVYDPSAAHARRVASDSFTAIG